MIEVKKEESIKIKGGAISITLVNAFISLGKLTFDIGKSLGLLLEEVLKMFVKFKKLILIISGSILSFTLFYLIGLLITQIIFR